MPAGQVVNIVVCSATDIGLANGQIAGPVSSTACPSGQSAYVVQSYVPFTSSQAFIDGLMAPFDSTIASGIFGFGFGLVVFFYLLGLKGSVLIKPFWSGWH